MTVSRTQCNAGSSSKLILLHRWHQWCIHNHQKITAVALAALLYACTTRHEAMSFSPANVTG